MPFFNCSTSLFAYIIYFGGEKKWEEKILDGVTAHHISVLSGGGGVGMLLIMFILLKIKHNEVYLLYIICIIRIKNKGFSTFKINQ